MQQSHTVFGLHAVQHLLTHSPDRVLSLWIRTGRLNARLQQLVVQAQQHGVTVHFADSNQLDTKVIGVHQGVVADVTATPVYRENQLAELVNTQTASPLLLVLDGVTDPHNLGACLRTADAAGVQGLIVPKDKSASLNATVKKVACGAAETVPFVQVTNLVRTLLWLQAQGIWVVGTAEDSTDSIYQTDLTGPLALVIGAEGKGMRRLTRKHCDLLASIPMQGAVSSLNVSVATGVCLFEARRQRQALLATSTTIP